MTNCCTPLTHVQISELREHLDEIPTTAHSQDDSSTEVPGPGILFGRQRHASKQELLAALPPRTEADQLVFTYFASMDTLSSKFQGCCKMVVGQHWLTDADLVHRPTFLKEVRTFTVLFELRLTLDFSMLSSGTDHLKHLPCGLGSCSPSSL